MTFVPTIDPNSNFAPDYQGTRRVERWTATAAAEDAGIGTIQPRFLTQVDDFSVEAFGGSPPSSCAIVNGKLLMYLPGTTTATSYRVKMYSRY